MLSWNLSETVIRKIRIYYLFVHLQLDPKVFQFSNASILKTNILFTTTINKFRGTARSLRKILHTSYFKPIGIGKREISTEKNFRIDDGTNVGGSRDSKALLRSRGTGVPGHSNGVFPHLSQDRSIPMLGESNVLPGNDFPGRRCNYTVHPAQ